MSKGESFVTHLSHAELVRIFSNKSWFHKFCQDLRFEAGDHDNGIVAAENPPGR